MHLPGHRADLVPYYRAMDVLAISSDSEQLPVALLEAMACELPVVGTDVGDVGVTVAEEGLDAVLSVEDADAGGLTAGLARLLADAPERARRGAANRRRVEERFSHDVMVGTYRGLYDEAIRAGKPSTERLG